MDRQRPYLDDVPEDIQDLVYLGHKIDAIRAMREREEVDLAEAKDRVEDIERRLREKAPDHFPTPAGQRGCLSMVLLVTGSAALVYLVC